MRYFTEEDEVRKKLPMQDAIRVLRGAFAEFAEGRAQHQPRRRLYLETGAVLHSMTGACGRYFGTKVYATHAKHGAWFTVLLFDAETAHPLAQFEASWLGQIRTGAVSGLATDLLAPAKPLKVGCIGSGFQARSQIEAVAAVRPLESVRVWSRSPQKREALAAELRTAFQTQAEAASSVELVAEGADVLITATWSKDPVIEDTAVAGNTVVLAIGSNNAARRELPGALVQRAFVVVEDTEACRIEAGDLVMAFDETDWGRVVELKNLVANPAMANKRGNRPAVFKSVGIGLDDVAVAGWILEQAG
jgi:ornithine cyclodeaminase/alanine dehydrogenase-like protein (mu-crystallin family)